MNKIVLKNLLKSMLILSLIVSSTFGQYTKGNTVVAWSKYKWKDLSKVEGASGADWSEAGDNYFTSRNKVDKLLKSSLMLTHYWSGSSEDVHFVNEFANMEDATLWSGNESGLNKKAWPNADDRKSALSAWNKYFASYHEDLHVFENHVAFRKTAKKKKDSPRKTVLVVTTSYWKRMSDVTDGTTEEREKLMKKYFNKVTMKNDKVISQRVVTHLWSGHVENGLWPVTYIKEFANMADADDTESENKLIDKVFKTDEDKMAHGKYWADKHDDVGVFYNETWTNK